MIKRLIFFLAAISSVAHAETQKIQLVKFSPFPELELRCINGNANVSVPVPDRWQVNRMKLALRYTGSSNLIQDTSQLAIRINDQPIAQTKLIPLAPNEDFSVNVPVRVLKAGYNTITFQVAQHFSHNASGCENPCAPDLWTNISLLDSYLEVDYDLKPLPLKLGLVANWLFDPKMFPEAHVNIVTESVDAKQTTTAGIVASGIARRFDYRKTIFHLRRELMPSTDNVIVGSPYFVERMVKPLGIELGPVKGALLRLAHSASADGGTDQTHALLIVTGDSPAAIRLAATTLANISLPYPGGPELQTTGFSLPDLAMYGGRQVLTTDKSYDFRTLNFSTYSWQGMNAAPVGINFRLPADFLIKQNQFAKAVLNFSYSAGLRNDSMLNIIINGKPLRSIYLDQVSGSYIDGYKLDIPTYVFQPGANSIIFSAVLNLPKQICDASQTDGTFLTVYDNSTLKFPPMPHLVEMPKLELFALNGFPFTRWPDGFESLIYVPQGDPAGLEAALNMIGMITQKNGFPLFGMEIVTDEPRNWKGEIMIIGQVGSIPEGLLQGAPLKSAKESRIPYPIARGWDTETAVAISRQSSRLGPGVGVVMQYESPLQLGHSVVLILAETSEDVSKLGLALLDPAVQGAVKGDLMFIEFGEPEKHKVLAMSVGPRYTSGNKGDVNPIDAFLFSNPWTFYALVALVVLGLAGLTWLALRRYRRKRSPLPAPSKD
jgi:cellulose synthase operon protein B